VHQAHNDHEQVAFSDPFVIVILDLDRCAMEILHAHALHTEALNSIECGLAVPFQVAPRRAEKDSHWVRLGHRRALDDRAAPMPSDPYFNGLNLNIQRHANDPVVSPSIRIRVLGAFCDCRASRGVTSVIT
jgi:hypothetical protein